MPPIPGAYKAVDAGYDGGAWAVTISHWTRTSAVS
jgi:hypothetical protein